jgi:hypothetical protein
VAAGGSVSVCFSPGGRAYVNPTGVFTPAAWSSLNTVLDVAVTGVSGTKRSHRIVILPNGSARLAL